jgi:uncharacterized protein (DUF1778 family)
LYEGHFLLATWTMSRTYRNCLADLMFLCVKLTYNNSFSFGDYAMPATLTNESARINLRTSAEAKAMIERAAALMGTTVSSFMLQNAFEAARRIVSETDTLLLTQRDFEAFAASIENPPKPKAALRKLMARS